MLCQFDGHAFKTCSDDPPLRICTARIENINQSSQTLRISEGDKATSFLSVPACYTRPKRVQNPKEVFEGRWPGSGPGLIHFLQLPQVRISTCTWKDSEIFQQLHAATCVRQDVACSFKFVKHCRCTIEVVGPIWLNVPALF